MDRTSEPRRGRNSEVVNFTCVCSGVHGRPSRVIFPPRVSQLCFWGLFSHSPPFDTSFLPRTSSRNITLSRYFPSNGTDRPRLRESSPNPQWTDADAGAERLRFDCGFEKWRKFVFFFGSAVQKGQFLIGRLFPERRGRRRTRTRPSSSFIAIRWLPLERASSVRAERASCSKFQRGTHSRQPRLSEERDSGGRRRRRRAFILPKSFASASPRHVA